MSPCSSAVVEIVPIDDTRLNLCPANSMPFCTYREPQPKLLLMIETSRRAMKRRRASFRTSESHFDPRWCTNVHLSEANQADTAARPNEVNAVKTVVIVDVTFPWCVEYVNSTSPAEKQATDITKNTRGDRLIHISTHHGTRSPGDRYIACFQESPSKLLTAAAMLNTSEENQNAFTPSESISPV